MSGRTAWVCNPGSATSVVALWGHSQGEGGVWESTLTHPGHSWTWQRKGARGTRFRPRVLGQTQRQGAETLRLLLAVEVCPVRAMLEVGGRLPWRSLPPGSRLCSNTLGAHFGFCILLTVESNVKLAMEGTLGFYPFAPSCAASILKVTPTSGSKVATGAPDMTPAPQLSGRRSDEGHISLYFWEKILPRMIHT